MKVVKVSDVKAEEDARALFTGGKVCTQSLVNEKDSEQFRVSMINFAPGARNKFHTHTVEQVLIVTAGKGIVATGQEQQVVTPGVLVFIPTGERHWHGATADSPFSHLSITRPGGKTSF